MGKHFDQELEQLSSDILKMGVMVKEAIQKSIEALKNRDASLAQKVIKDDDMIDHFELETDEKCLDLIARHQPMASDLRFITTGQKINAELERIADLAVDIAQRVLELVDKEALKPLIDILVLSEIAQKMVSEAIEAFIKRDPIQALQVIKQDQQADNLRNQVQSELINNFIIKDGQTAYRAIPLLLIARHLERMADHATNIAEDVVYIVEAKNIKHKSRKFLFF